MGEGPGSPRSGATSGEGVSGLPPNVIKAGLVSFFADISSEMLYPLTPILLTSILGAPVAVVGLIEGVAESIASLVKPVAGRFSDRSGKRVPFMVSGYSLSALGKPLIALAQTWPIVLVARAVDRLGKGVRTGARDAYIADSVDESVRGRAFGWHRALDTAGAVVGALLSLLLLWLTHDNLRLVVWLAFIPAVISVYFVARLKETPPPASREVPVVISGERRVVLSSGFRWYVATWGVFALANSSDAFIILRAKGLGLSTTAVVFLYVLYNAVYAVASPRLGSLSDRVGRRRLLVGGLLVFAAVYVGLAAVRNVWQLVVLFACYGLYVAATEGVGKALAVDLAPVDARASAVGMLGMVSGIATLLASLVAGVLWSAVGPWAAFIYGAVGAFVAAAMLMVIPALRHV